MIEKLVLTYGRYAVRVERLDLGRLPKVLQLIADTVHDFGLDGAVNRLIANGYEASWGPVRATVHDWT